MRRGAIQAVGPAFGVWLLVMGAGLGCGPRPGELIASCPTITGRTTERPPGLGPAPDPAAGDRPLLSAPGWLPAVRDAVGAFVRATGRPDLPADERPVAALALNGVALVGDLAEALLLRLIEARAFRPAAGFWDAIPEGITRDELRGDWTELEALPSPVPPDRLGSNRHFRAWRRGMLQVYATVRADEGPAQARRWLVRVLVGLHPGEVRAYAAEALDRGMSSPPDDIDGAPRVRPESRELVAALQRHGFEVWIVTDTVQWAAEVAAQRLGVPPHHVIGAQPERGADGCCLGHSEQPVPYGPGKVAALRTFVGRPPALAAGAGLADREMLSAATGLAIIIGPDGPDGPEDSELTEAARAEGWLVQPPFPPPASPAATAGCPHEPSHRTTGELRSPFADTEDTERGSEREEGP